MKKLGCLAALSALIIPNASVTGRSSLPPAPQSIAALHAALRAPNARCTQIIASYIKRALRLDGKLHALIEIAPEAMAEAVRIDATPMATRRQLPLACVPLLVKDNIDVAGFATTGGSAVLTGNIASTDSAAVARLKRAGAIVIAKTNMSEFALDFKGRSSLDGQTSSPYAVSESAGGSSSGNAAALAAGLGLIALGTDTSGSARVPAALAGTTGLRPTFGTIPLDGVMGLSPSQDVIGPMCLDPLDCATVLRVLSPKTPEDAQTLRGLRVGVLRAFITEPRQVAALDKALQSLRTAGAHVSDTHLRDELVLTGTIEAPGKGAKFASRSVFDFPDVMDHYLPTRSDAPTDAAQLLKALQGSSAKGQSTARVVEQVSSFMARRAGKASDPRYEANGSFRDRFVRERLDEAFACYGSAPCFDILVYPSVQGLYALAQTGPETAGTHRFAAYSGRPALAFPLGTAMTPVGPRPVSLEILGREGDDLRLLAIASTWQRLAGKPRIVDCDTPTGAVCLSLP
ncbi:amidase [Novosphingobium indicum]|uniref:Amidase n=2 Tax=Novosphingobium indicum TaxID=462949 RepID=A0ABQ2JZ00_9SPHN|nr:amidase [Novosphingobium indicum]